MRLLYVLYANVYGTHCTIMYVHLHITTKLPRVSIEREVSKSDCRGVHSDSSLTAVGVHSDSSLTAVGVILTQV